MKQNNAVNISAEYKEMIFLNAWLKCKSIWRIIDKMPLVLLLISMMSGFSVLKGEDDPADSLLNIGHASMKIKTSDGKVIYIDPYQTPGDYSDSADIILVTHSHQDHGSTSLIKQKEDCTLITYADANIGGVLQNFIIGNIRICTVPAYNANHNRNSCVGYIIEFNGIKLYHAGDTDNIPEMADLADSSITYALLPCDGVYNMGPEEATQAADSIQADYSIPIHTEPPPDNYSEDIVARFTPSNKLLVRHGETIALRNPSTYVKNQSKLLPDFELFQNYPNPFNPGTRIHFILSNESFVNIKIYDANGSEAAVLVKNVFPAGEHVIEWNANNFPSGVYFIMLQANDFIEAKKCVLLK